ncbi:neuralized-like protein 4 [Saccoglossus kowalevskii]|uniref:Neuralized-like protein 4-like n=1 Tax=Saccoglossus kowalevskii TaxID=10224 RepID=A0ABM0GYV5_SACKO|nr:PREDICTED: neuralized-like protein 4-like [Saccoglossus kowalevskii]
MGNESSRLDKKESSTRGGEVATSFERALTEALREIIEDCQDSTSVTPEQIQHGWDPADCSANMAVLEDGVTARRSTRSMQTDAIRGKKGYRSGTHTFEFKCISRERGSHAMVGIATPDAPLSCDGYSNLLGSTSASWGWNLTDRNLVHNGKVIGKYPPKSNYSVPDTFYAILNADKGILSFKANDEDLGVAFNDLPRQNLLKPLCVATCASKDSCDIRMKYMGCSGKITQFSETGEQVVSTVAPTGRTYYTLHPNCGDNIQLMHNGRVAKRQNAGVDFNDGVVMTAQPLKTDELFEVRLDTKVARWSGCLEIGFTSNAPDSFQIPPTMTQCKEGVTLMWSGSNIMKNGKKVIELDTDLDDCSIGDTIGIVRRDDESFHLYYNGEVLRRAVRLRSTPSIVYGVIDLYGQAERITVLGTQLTGSLSASRAPAKTKIEATGNDPNSVMMRMRETLDLIKMGSDIDIRTVSISIAQHILQPYHDTESERLRQRFGDHLADIGAAAELKQLLERLNAKGMGSEHVWLGMNVVRSSCWNYSDASLRFCKQLGQCGILEMMLKDLDRYGPHSSTDEKKRFIVVSAMSILHNSAKATENKDVYFRLRAVQRISPFLKSNDKELASDALLTLSYVVEDDKVNLLEADSQSITIILQRLQSALTNPTTLRSAEGGYSARELVTGLGNIGANDKNKMTIVDNGAVPLLVDLMKVDRHAEQECAANTLWILARLDRNKGQIAKNREVIPTLTKLTASSNLAVKQAADRALMRVKPVFGLTQVYIGPSADVKCAYRSLCERFKTSLKLSEYFFNEEYDMCYCTSCHCARGDKLYYARGNPAKDYGVPMGWCRFALKVPERAKALEVFEKWHVAFHGTTVRAVKPILEGGDLLFPGDIILGGKELREEDGHFTDDFKPEGFDTKQLFLSPSIRYSGCDVYAKTTDFKDTLTKKRYKARVVFQVCIRPASYKVGRETIAAEEEIDPKFSNQEIEWFTKERGCVILYGLLVKME